MKTKTSNYNCDSCESGVVSMTETVGKIYTTVRVSKCTKCKKQHGIKSILRLKEIIEKPTKLDKVLDNLFDTLFDKNGSSVKLEEENPFWTNK